MKPNLPGMPASCVLQLLSLLFLLAACAPANVPPSVMLAKPTTVPMGTEPTQITEPADSAAPTPDLSATPAPLDANPQQAALLQFILTELAGTEKQHLLVAQVKANPNDSRGHLNLGAENILRAWIYQDGDLNDCSPKFYIQSYTREPNGNWKYAYMAFSLNKVSPDFSAATMRIDRIPGLAGGKGELFELVRECEKWTVKSQHVTWIL